MLAVVVCFSLAGSSVGRAQMVADSVRVLEGAAVVAARPMAREVDTTLLRNTTSYSISDAVRFTQGVQLKDYGGVGGLKSINVRGMGTQHTQVTMDGIAVGNAQNGVVDLGRFASQGLDGIVLQTSSGFSTARDLSLLSNIRLTTARAERDELTGLVRVGAWSTYSLTMAGSKVWKRWAVAATLEGLMTDGDFKFRLRKKDGYETAYDTTMRRHNGQVRVLRQSADVWGPNGLHIKEWVYLSKRGYPGAAVRQEPGKFINADKQWDADVAVQAQWRLGQVKNRTKVNWNWCHYKSDPTLDVSTMYVSNYYRQTELYHSSAYERRVARWLQVGGAVDLQYNYLNANLVDFVYPSRYQLYAAVNARATWNGWRVEASLLNHLLKDKTKESETSQAFNKTINKLLPTLQAAYGTGNYGAQLTLKWSARNPTFNDLYYTLIGNRNLDPEEAWQVELQQEWTPGRWELALTGFYSETQDKIVAVPTSNQFRWTMMNLGEVHAWGLEPSIAYRTKLGDWELRGKASYTYEHAQDITSEYDGQIPYIPYHSFTFVGTVSWRQWQMVCSVLYTGKRWDSTANIEENEIKPWYTTDLTLQYTRARWDATLQVNNLFNQQYEIVRCYPMPGTNVTLALRIVISD